MAQLSLNGNITSNEVELAFVMV